MANDTYLFVYGTLRKELNHPIHRVLSMHAVEIGKGIFQGRLYDLGRYPGAVPSSDESERVTGEIYRIQQDKPVFEALDAYEGAAFTRERRFIALAGGKKIPCWIYLYTRPTAGRRFIPSGDYKKFAKSG